MYLRRNLIAALAVLAGISGPTNAQNLTSGNVVARVPVGSQETAAVVRPRVVPKVTKGNVVRTAVIPKGIRLGTESAKND